VEQPAEPEGAALHEERVAPRQSVAAQLVRLARHSAIYGLGGLVARILAIVLLPLYTRYLTRADYGAIGTLIALTSVLAVLLRLGTQSAFFRFYFDSREPEERLVVVRTAFWFTMTMATAGLAAGLLFASPISQAIFGSGSRADLVRAAFVGLWAQMNYGQLTSLFRVEERSTSFVFASLANVLVTVGATVILVVGYHQGALGVIVGNFTGTLVVYLGLLAYRREQLGLQFDWGLFKRMEHFGLPLVPSAIALWAINFVDRFFLVRLSGQGETGLYQLGVQISSVIVFLLMAFRMAWPAFAYSIEDDREAKRTYPYVLTYLLFLCSWLSLALGLLAPWIVHLLATPKFYDGAKAVALLSFAATAYAGYAVVVIGVGRARQTRFNWIVTGAAAALNIGLNVALIPPYGQIGAAIATLAAYALMFAGMTWNAQRLFPVPYQWRRIGTLIPIAVGLTVLGKLVHVSLPLAIVLVALYPFVLALTGFYLPSERSVLRRLYPAR
jgi:O-antigen/teichoic acid export membrane protein